MIRAGDVDVVVTGGMESMSNAPYLLKKARFGYRLGDGDADRLDGLRRAHLDVRPAAHGLPELEGRARARHLARAAGRVGRALAGARRSRVRTRGASTTRSSPSATSTADESIRRDTTVEKLAALKPVFDPDRNDDRRQRARRQRRRQLRDRLLRGWAKQRGLEPLATILSQGYVADDFAYLARTPANAGAIALERAGKTIGDVDARRDQRGVRVGRLELARGCSAPTRSRSTSTAARSRSATRSARRADGSSGRWCTSCGATAAGSASPRSARAAARATRS